MLDGIITNSKAALGNGLKMAGWGAAIAVAGIAALFFFTLAAFIWTQDNHGTVTACLVLGGVYAVAAIAIAIGLAVNGRSRRREAVDPEPAKANSHWWADPAVVATGVELLRIVGIRRIVPAVAVGVALFAALQARSDSSKR